MSDLMREQFEKKYKAPTGCYWNSMTGEYGQSWDELSGDDDIEKEIRIHNDRFLVWKASRECLVIELPPEPEYPDEPDDAIDDSYMDEYHSSVGMRHACINFIHAAGVKTK